jgi:hypothetical protein
MSMEERRVFESFTTAFDVHDPFPSSNRVKFSWDNRRQGQGRTMARLDRIYTPKDTMPVTSASDYVIIGDCAFSYHMPVKRRLELVVEPKRQSPYVMNASFLKEAEVKGKIMEIWSTHANLLFFGKVKRCVDSINIIVSIKLQKRSE